MNKESELVFIVGPGGAGKSTTGEKLARRLAYDFVDVDMAFCQRIALIPDFIHQFGYKAYCEANSGLVDQLLTEHTVRTVVTMPSGFLVMRSHRNLLRNILIYFLKQVFLFFYFLRNLWKKVLK